MIRDRRTRLILMTAAALAIGLPNVLAQAEEKPTAGAASVSKPELAKVASPIAQQFAAIRAEYEATNKKAEEAANKAKTEFENWKIYLKLHADEAVFSRRMVDLAATAPKDPASRDVLLWVLDKPRMAAPWEPCADEFSRAVNLLLRHHGEDPEVARMGLQLVQFSNVSWAQDAFFEGVYIQAKVREAKGLTRLALGRYLQVKADRIATLRGPALPKRRIQDYDGSGKLIEKDFEFPPDALAYQLHLRLTDPEATRAEAKRLYEEVIEDYGDIPLITPHRLKLESLLKEPSPSLNGEPLKPGDRKEIERFLAQRKTLADVAKANLDEIEKIAIGKPAPPIEGESLLDGKSLKLADYRGKVVVLVFWGTWCGPCMAAVPHERELAARYKDRPFTLLGIDCDRDKDAARKVMKDEKITWPNWNDGDPGEGPIVQSYHVRQYPSTFVIDAKGIIRHINYSGSALDNAMDALLKELEEVNGLWSIETRGVLAVLGFLLSLSLLVAGWSSRTGSKTAILPPPRLILDPNTAPPEILTALPGLGPGLVRNWIAAREERPFRSLDDLERRVRGIGPATLARIAPYLEIAVPFE